MEELPKQDNRILVTQEGALVFARNVQDRVTAMFNHQGFVIPAAFVFMTWDPNKECVLDPPLVGRLQGDLSDPVQTQAFQEAIRNSARLSKAVGVLTVMQLEEQEIRASTTGDENVDELFGLAAEQHLSVKDVVLLSFEHLRFASGLRVWSAPVLHSDRRALLGEFEEISEVDRSASPFAGHLRHFN